jgi:hypothetical protein
MEVFAVIVGILNTIAIGFILRWQRSANFIFDQSLRWGNAHQRRIERLEQVHGGDSRHTGWTKVI